MPKSSYYLIAASFILGLFCFAYFQEWIIIRIAHSRSLKATTPAELPASKQTVKFIYWQNDTWHTEQQKILWTHDKALNIQYLINNWLNLLDEEGVMDKKVTVQTTLLSATQNAVYISFDRTPFNPESATFEKWMWMEGLLKTLRGAITGLQKVHILSHHQPLADDHLDFNFGWPITGFLSN